MTLLAADYKGSANGALPDRILRPMPRYLAEQLRLLGIGRRGRRTGVALRLFAIFRQHRSTWSGA